MWVKATGAKVCIVFEGRDGAGKGGVIKADHRAGQPARLPRHRAARADRAREVADVHPALHAAPARAGEVVIFDRSWYNRAGVERVMGFTPMDAGAALPEHRAGVERAMVDSGIILLKYWLEVSMEEQTPGCRAHRRPAQDLEALARWTSSPTAAGTTIPAPGMPCCRRPTRPGRPGTWCIRTTRSARG
jgi:polyphosphate kinase